MNHSPEHLALTMKDAAKLVGVDYRTIKLGIESGTIQSQDIFTFRARDQGGPEGRVRGEFSPTGVVPEFYEELAERGVPVDLGIFRKQGD